MEPTRLPNEKVIVSAYDQGKDAVVRLFQETIEKLTEGNQQEIASPLSDATPVEVIFQDISLRKKNEAELDEQRQRLERMVAERTTQLNRSNQQLRTEIAMRQYLEDELRLRLKWSVTVNRANEIAIRKNDLPQIYQRLTSIISEIFGATDTFIAELDADRQEFIIRTHSTEGEFQVLQSTLQDWLGFVISLPPAIISDPEGLQSRHFFFSREQLGTLDGQLREYFRTMNTQLMVFTPIRSQERLIGLLGLEYLETEHHFSASEIVLLEKISADITQIYENAQLFEQNRALAATEERNRLARDLHDSVTQVLFAANLVAEVLPRVWVRDPQLGQKSLEELRRLTRGALAEMRTMLLDLRPAAVIKTPLHELLMQLVEAVSGRSGLTPQLLIEQIPTLPEEVHICFYRIAQESLNNVIKHANASQVSISLMATPAPADATNDWIGELKLVVSDNGNGIVQQSPGTQRLGLGIMRERAYSIHADLFVDSRPGEGTTITLIWKN